MQYLDINLMKYVWVGKKLQNSDEIKELNSYYMFMDRKTQYCQNINSFFTSESYFLDSTERF
jgi:hypothetical protein